MNELETLIEIALDITSIKKSIKWKEDMRKNFSPIYKGDTTKLEIQIKDLENQRIRIIRKLFDQYCK